MGNSSSTTKFEQALGPQIPPSERFYGFENFGNTCYCNSVLQVLYFCAPFRKQILQLASEIALEHEPLPSPSSSSSSSSSPSSSGTSSVGQRGGSRTAGNSTNNTNNNNNSTNSTNTTGATNPGSASKKEKEKEDSLLPALCRLFWVVSHQKERSGVHSPNDFVTKLRQQNILFRPYTQQDAHEFLIYLLNDLTEALVKREKEKKEGGGKGEGGEGGGEGGEREREGPKTFIHELFQGFLVNETKCMCCEAITTKDEPFFDLSVDIEPNVSLSRCLKKFSETEMLSRQNKFFCEQCRSLQEAQKRMKVKKFPKILIIHLKRFKYIEQINQMAKLSYRVVFPFELSPKSTLEVVNDDEVIYDLSSIVVHVGSGPSHGHYISLVKSHSQWIVFDDQVMEVVSELNVQPCFGSTQSPPLGSVSCGYLLIYTKAETNNH